MGGESPSPGSGEPAREEEFEEASSSLKARERSGAGDNKDEPNGFDGVDAAGFGEKDGESGGSLTPRSWSIIRRFFPSPLPPAPDDVTPILGESGPPACIAWPGNRPFSFPRSAAGLGVAPLPAGRLCERSGRIGEARSEPNDGDEACPRDDGLAELCGARSAPSPGGSRDMLQRAQAFARSFC